MSSAACIVRPADAAAQKECAVVVGERLSDACREQQEEERALYGVVTGSDTRAR